MSDWLATERNGTQWNAMERDGMVLNCCSFQIIVIYVIYVACVSMVIRDALELRVYRVREMGDFGWLSDGPRSVQSKSETTVAETRFLNWLFE